MGLADKLLDRVKRRVDDSGVLRPGEEVRGGITTLAFGSSGSQSGSSTMPLGVVGDLLVINPLQKKLGKKMTENRYQLPEGLQADKFIDSKKFGQVFVVTNQRFIVFPEKGMSGGLEDPVAEGPIAATDMIVFDGGKKLWKHRSFHVTFPDGRFTVREVAMAGPAKKQGEAFVAAYEAAKAAG